MGGPSYRPHGNPGSNMVDTERGSAGVYAKNLKPSGKGETPAKMGAAARAKAASVAQKRKARKKLAGMEARRRPG